MTPDALTPRQRRLSLAVVIAGVFGVGVAFGAMIPLIALRLERDGVDTALIGLNSAMFPLAVLAIGPFLPRLVGRLGTLRSMYTGLALGGATILLFPLFLVLFGRGYATTIFVGFIAAVVPIVLKTREAFLAVPRVLFDVGRSFRLSEAGLVRRIAFPAAVPGIFTGLRLALIYALVNIIGMEFLIDFGGLGRIVSEMYFRYEIPGMYAAILLIVAVSWMFLAALGRLETWLRPR